MTRERCSICRCALLWVHGASRCCNPQCPGDPQTRLDVEPPTPTTTKKAA